MTKLLFRSLICTGLALICVVGAREVLISKMKSEVLGLASEGVPEIRLTDSWEISLLDFSRGDFLLELHQPPLKPLRFTINRYSSAIVSWDSDQKRKDFAKKSFQKN